MKEFVPLVQTLLWVILFVALIFYFRVEIDRLRQALIERIEKGSPIKIGPIEMGELKEQVAQLGGAVGETHKEVDTLKFLASHMLTKPEAEHLRKIASKEAFIANTDDNWDSFRDEIRHLYNLGFIDYHRDNQGQDLFRSNGPNLRNVNEYCDIREPGREYLKLLAQVSVRNEPAAE